MWQCSWRADPCLSVSTLPFNSADISVRLLLILPPSAVFHQRAHNCLARPTAALKRKYTERIKKESFSPVNQAPVKVEDLGRGCFAGSGRFFILSQTTALTLAKHNMKVFYAKEYLTLLFSKPCKAKRKDFKYFLELFLTPQCVFTPMV